MGSVTHLVDSRQCWIVAVSMAIYIYFAMGVIKSSAVLYVGSMQMLPGTTRQEASWPATLALMLSQLAGPVYGVLLKFTSERVCLILGAILCAAPLIGAAYVADIVSLCALVGFVHGFGCACSEVIPFVILMRHFQRYRGTVISAMYIITAVSGFIMPVVFENIRQHYDFRTCLLVMGGLNFGMLCGCIVVSRVPINTPINGGAPPAASNALPAPPASKVLSDVSLSTDSFLVGSILITRSQQHHSRTSSFADVESFREKTPLMQSQHRMRQALAQQCHNQVTLSFPSITARKPGVLSLSFLHITISRAVTVFTLAVFLLILLDYSADRHLEPVQGVLLLTVFTVGDLFSRILSGSLIDLQIVSPALLMSATFLVQGVSYLMMIYVNLYGALLVASFLAGLTGGCRNILATVMVTEGCEDSYLALSLGLMNFATGVAIVVQPTLIGYVRDTIGTYEPLLLGFAAVNCFLAFTWLLNVLCNLRRTQGNPA